MKFNRIVLVSILLLIFAIGAVSAADDNMTDTADEVLSAEPIEDLEVSQPEDFSELVGLIKNTSSGKTLTLEKDYINDGTYTKGILISKKMTIDGQGHTLDANNKSNIFRISNNQVILKNINFINSYTKDYSAVYGACTVINCTFTDCTSEKDGGALYNGTAYDSTFINCNALIDEDFMNTHKDYNKGGAIYQGDAYNCSFVGCHAICVHGYDVTGEWDADGYGGAIYKGNAYDSSFIDCSSGLGGAIYQGDAHDCYFEDCGGVTLGFSVGFGGAIYQGDAYNCSFMRCYAYSGGAVYRGNVYNSSFKGCWAYEGIASEGTGGAISAGNAENCYFEECHADNGGAISSGNATGCSFVECISYTGSAIYIGNAYDCYFEECSNGEYGDGGVIYMGNVFDSTFINCSSSKKDLIIKGSYSDCIFIPFTFSCTNLTVNYGEGGKLTISTVEGSNGLAVNVGIYKDNKLINSFPSKTGADLIIDADPGSYIIALTSEYADPLNVSVTVNKGSPKLALANNFAKSGETANVKISMSKKAAGFVKITINGETYRVQIKSGVASVDVPNLADGAYTVKATYGGNVYHTAETMTDTFHVGKFNQGMKLAVKNIKVGETERLTATLAKDATGFVRFIIGEDTYKVAIENGVAYVDLKDLKAGTYSVTLKYNGNYKYNAETVSKSFSVSKSSPAITITTSNFNIGETATINVNLAKDAPGNVLITVNGESQKVKINNGLATLSLPSLKAGTYEISAKYNGNYKYNAETVTETFTLSKLSPEISIRTPQDDVSPYRPKVGSNGNITVSIANDAPGNVLITINGESQKVKIQNGKATLTLYDLKAGYYEISAKYAGNYKYDAQTVSSHFQVDKYTATMTATAKIENGKTIITVKTKTDATGNIYVTFREKTYTAELINGVATISADSDVAGSFKTKIKYSGNDKYTANTVTQYVSVPAN